MKKFFKFLAGTALVAAIGAGAYYAYKKFIACDGCDDEDADEDLDDFEMDDEDEDDAPLKTPEYVSINPATADDGSANE